MQKTTEDEPAVVVSNLIKSYGALRAVDDLSFTVNRGEIFALLGPNGAGKSTTVEILEGYRRADSGTVQVLGLDPARSGGNLRSQIGVMLQGAGLYLTITPREALRLFAAFYPQSRDPDEMLALVGLTDSAHIRYRRLSGGQRQRLSLAVALIGRPELVFLDEATAGMDPHARRSTWTIVRSLRDEGVTVLLTTHYLEEAERLADRVAIIDRGHLLTIGTPTELSWAGGGSVRMRTGTPIDMELVAGLPGALAVRDDGHGVYVFQTKNPSSLLVEITKTMRDVGIPILELRVGEESLEDLFLRLTGDKPPG